LIPIIRVKISRLFYLFLFHFIGIIGTIDFNEFLLAYIATNTGTNRQKFEYAFEVFDINENDRIERKEAEKILKIICRIIGLSEADAKMYTETVILSFDTNQDQVLTKEEFINGCLHDSTLGRIVNPFNII
jgi:neurocalcin delta